MKAWFAAVLVGILLGVALSAPDLFTGTGRATSTFSAGVTVVGITFNTTNTSQLTAPATGGANVNLTQQITYTGAGIQNVTVEKPTGYETGQDWFVIEDGAYVPVTVMGNNLRWTADLGASPVTLHFTALPPAVTLEGEVSSGSSYSRTVTVSADVHYTNVTASTTVDSTLTGATLTENGTDVTALYGFGAANGVATWSGFNLSSRTFLIEGTITPAEEQSRGRHHQYAGTPYTEPPVDVPLPASPSFTVTPLTATLALEEGQRGTLPLTLVNTGDTDITLTFGSPAFYVGLPAPATLLPGEHRTVELAVTPPRTGTLEATVLVSSSARTERVLLTILVPEPPATEAPQPISADVPAPGRRWPETFDIVLLVAFVLAAVANIVHFRRR